LLNKKVEFHKTISPIDDESRFAFDGNITEVEGDFSLTNQIIISVKIKEKIGDELYLTKVYTNTNSFSHPSKAHYSTIKIYNSQKTDVEEKIDMLKNIKKYNL